MTVAARLDMQQNLSFVNFWGPRKKNFIKSKYMHAFARDEDTEQDGDTKHDGEQERSKVGWSQKKRGLFIIPVILEIHSPCKNSAISVSHVFRSLSLLSIIHETMIEYTFHKIRRKGSLSLSQYSSCINDQPDLIVSTQQARDGRRWHCSHHTSINWQNLELSSTSATMLNSKSLSQNNENEALSD